MASSSSDGSQHNDGAAMTITYPPTSFTSSIPPATGSSSRPHRTSTTSSTAGSPRKVLQMMPSVSVHDDVDIEAQTLAASTPLPPSRMPSRPSIDTAISSTSVVPGIPATPASSVTAAMTPAMRARVGLSRRLWTGVSAMRTRSRFFLLCRGILAIAQVVALIVTLSLSSARGQACGKPIQTYLAVYLVKTALTYPINFYITLAPPSQPPRGTPDVAAWRAAREGTRVVGSPALDSLLRSIADLLVIFAIVWFVLGNVWTLNSSGLQCKDTAPLLFWSSIATLCLAYLRILEFVLIIIAIVFFLPAVIILLRLTGTFEKKHEIGPLSKEEIAKLPVVVYVPAPAVDMSTDDTVEKEDGAAAKPANGEQSISTVFQAASSATSMNAAVTHKKHSKLQRLFTGRKGKKVDSPFSNNSSHVESSIYVATPFRQHPLPDNLSSCPICLCDFEPPPLLTASAEEQKEGLSNLEQLNLLPCRHAIHKDCLAPWLQTSGRCPVCQQAIFPDKQAEGKKSGQAAASGLPSVIHATAAATPTMPPASVPDAASRDQIGNDTEIIRQGGEESVIDRHEE